MLRAVFYFVMIVLATIGVIIIGWGSYYYLTVDAKYHYRTVDILPSPTGGLTVHRVEKWLPSYVERVESTLMFALLRPGEQFNNKKVFLTTADNLDTLPSLRIFAKWTDEHNLLIAAPEGSILNNRQNVFDDVHIQYLFYPMDADKTKDEDQRRKIEKRVRFDSKFSQRNHGFAIPGHQCQLDLSAYDGEYLDNLSVSIEARTTFAHNAYDRGNIVLQNAYSEYYITISAHDEAERTNRHVTTAEVAGFSQKDGKATLFSFAYPDSKVFSGTFRPNWKAYYDPQNPQDLLSITQQIKNGTFAVRVGYWLDNEVVVYSGEKPSNREPIEMFEQCINENRILDTPRYPRRQ